MTLYEKTDYLPWHELLKKELRARDKKCNSKFGQNFVYKYPVNDPYAEESSGNKFKDKYRFQNKSSECVFINKNSVPNTKRDKDARYYKHIKNQVDCGKTKGEWSEKDINRFNKYDDGTCWTNHNNAVCGALGNTDLIRPSIVKKHIRDGTLKDKLENLKEKCSTDDRCKLGQVSKYSYDCVDVSKDSDKLAVPENFPYNITKEDNGISNFLYDWYVSKKYPVPKTSELIGTGNRCVASKKIPKIFEEEVKTMSQDEMKKMSQSDRMSAHFNQELYLNSKDHKNPKKQINKYTIEEMKKLDPNIEENFDLIKKYLMENYTLNKHYALSVANKIRKDYNSVLKGEQFDKYEAVKTDTDVDIPIDEIEEESEFGVPSVPQSIVNSVMKSIASNPKTTNRGLLAWFSTGAGKTICAVGVMEAFWDTPKQIIFASSLSALASNPPSSFYSAALNIFPRFQSEKYRGKNQEETLVNIENAFKERGVRFLSFAKLSNRVKKTVEHKKTQIGGANKAIKGKVVKDTKQVTKKGKDTKKGKVVKDTKKGKVVKDTKQVTKKKPTEETISDDNYVDLDNTILIIDEVHNLFRPEHNQAKEHQYLESRLIDPLKHKNLKISILTATPGDNVSDVVKLLNIVRDVSKPPISEPDTSSASSIERFKKDIIGLVSYFDMNGDYTKFPVVTDSPPILATMTDLQFKRYSEAFLKDTTAEHKNFDKLAKDNKTSKYYQPARKYSNTMFTYDAKMQLAEFSAKLPIIMKNFVDKEKHYVYSAFYERRGYGGHGVVSIAKELEKLKDKHKYVKLTVAEAMKHNKNGTLPEPKKRYILAIAKDLEEGYKGGTVGDNLKELLKIYNHAANKNGELVHIMLASNSFNEGIDLKAVRHIHFFEPLVTMASDMQTIGRAARNCSHADLDKDNWTVQIHRYMSRLPEKDELNTVSLTKNSKHLKHLEERLKDAQDRLDNIPKTEKENIKELKELIKSINVEIKQINKSTKDIQKVNEKNIENIEKKIFHESRERMKDILVIYHAMREAAIDCKVMEKFHATSKYPVKCM